jgi:rubrerythrin
MTEQPRALSDALKLAMEFEKEGLDYYRLAQDKCKHPLGKRMFESLAGDEINHMKRIKDIFDSLVSKGEWPSDLPMPRTQIKTVFKEAMTTIDKDIKLDENDLDAIDWALQLEKKGYEFYHDIGQKSTKQEEKEFFNILAQEESVHIDILQKTREYLQHPWDFYLEEEHSIFEGG